MERRSQKRPVRSGTFIARTHLHTYKKECVVFVLSRRSNSSAFFVFSRCGIRRARIARDPRDATVARRRPRVVDDDFVFFSPLVFWTNWTREVQMSTKITAKRKRKIDRRRDPRDAQRETPPETSERHVRVGTPRRQKARTRGNDGGKLRRVFSRNQLLSPQMYTHYRFGADKFFSSSLSQNRKKNSPA